MTRILSHANINYTAKLNAFPYQMQTFLTLKDLNYAAIFHEQGLGKTKIAIDLLLYWLQKRNIDTVIVVTKKQLVKNWIDEFMTHTFIHPKILSNKKGDNFYVFNSPAKVIVTNFETFNTERERLTLFLKCRDVGIIIDESAKIKNPQATITKTFLALSQLFKIRIIMTGTPVANRPYDIWSQIYFLDHGKSLGDDFQSFKKNLDLSNDFGNNNNKAQKFEEEVSTIFKKISAFTVRETKKSSGIVLPQKIYNTVYSEFMPIQQNMYEQVLHDMKIEIMKKGSVYIDDSEIILKRLLRLLEIASNPFLIDDGYKEIPGKVIVLDNIIKKIMNKGEKCIVWSSFVENIDILAARYKKYNPQRIHGEMSIGDRNQAVESFKKEERCQLLFATPQAAKEGLTLTVANNVVFYDRGFNLDDYLQAQDRIHRISQKKTCYVYNILMKDSIDVWINKLLQAKQYAAFLAQGDISIDLYRTKIDYGFGDLMREMLGVNKNE